MPHNEALLGGTVPRLTRASAAREASTALAEHRASISATSATKARPKVKAGQGAGDQALEEEVLAPEIDSGYHSPGNTSHIDDDQKAKEAANIGKKRRQVSDGVTEDDYEELPHNMGRVHRARNSQVQAKRLSSAEPPQKKLMIRNASVKLEDQEVNESDSDDRIILKSKLDADGVSKSTPIKKNAGNRDSKPRSNEKPKKPRTPRTPKPLKTNEYGLTPGVSPFPDYSHPTPKECYEVHRILKEHHPDCKGRPNAIPPPSQVVAGCGQVPSILDALIRTLLSAATTGKNSNSAYQGMVTRYGSATKGVGKGSVDYNAVRLAPQSDLEAAIASGGLAKAKSKNIKAILDMVYHENQERRKAHLASKSMVKATDAPKGAEEQTEEQKAAEVALAEDDVLSLDHYYALPTYDAIFTFVKYPGIGVKTAACTALFCMQRDCFAVDTHVFRLAQWLGWVPPNEKKVGRDTTFSHLEVRIPDELKYDLHQLFIKHGKTCPRCRASTGESSAKWESGCVIEHLVTRTGARKAVAGSSLKAKSSKSSAAKKKSRPTVKGSEHEDETDDEIPSPNDHRDTDVVEPSMLDVDDNNYTNSPTNAHRRPTASPSPKIITRSKKLPVSTTSDGVRSKKVTPTLVKGTKRTSRTRK